MNPGRSRKVSHLGPLALTSCEEIVAAEVTRLKTGEDRCIVTSAATISSQLLALCLAANAFAVESGSVIPWRQDRPPNEPCSPQEAVTKMTVPDGFTVELVAS